MSSDHTPPTSGDDEAQPIPSAPQRIIGSVMHAIDSIKQKFVGVAENHVLPQMTMTKSYTEPLVKLAELPAVNDRKCEIPRIMDEYAKSEKTIKDKDKMNRTMIKLFGKLAVNQSFDTGSLNTYYQCVKGSANVSDISADRIYETLFSLEKPQEHPNGISSLTFAFAMIMQLSLHREQSTGIELKDNGTSPYFDLSPLYGANEEETNKVRMKDGSGMLWPDCFLEDRLTMLPNSVPALLILWNRYHNYVAKQLLSYNERNKWHNPSKLSSGECLKQDDEIFKIARSITCIRFMNVIKEDFLKGLLGLPYFGPSAQLDILYDVKGKTNAKNYPSTIETFFLYNFLSFAPPSSTANALEQAIYTNTSSVDPDSRRRNYIGLLRNKQGYFKDSDLAEVLFNATETRAGKPGCATMPSWANEQEIRKIEQARKANVCTLNEFRKHLGLEPLMSFEEWNPSLASVAKVLYDHDIDKLELYPGLLGEMPFNGSSFCFGYTMTWGLITDIVSRIRCDPRFTTEFNERELTKWGFKDCLDRFDKSTGSFNAMLPTVLQRALPHNYSYDDVYCLFPFCIPERSRERLKELPESQKKKYNFDRPKQMTIKVLRTISAMSEVFNDPITFTSPYQKNLVELMGGYGHMLGFDDLSLHDRDLMLTLFSLMPDKGAVKRIGADFAQKAQENLVQRSTKSKDDKDKAQIDVVKDLIDATCTRWVCETLYNFHFEDEDLRGVSDKKIDAVRKRSQEKEREERDNFAYYYAYVFRKNEPEFGWNVRENALAASQHLRQHLKNNLPRDTEPSDARFFVYTLKLVTAFGNFVGQIKEEYSNKGKKVSQHSALTFLDRMMKTATAKPLKHLTDSVDHLAKLKKTLKKEAEEESEAGLARPLRERIWKEGIINTLIHYVDDSQISDFEADNIAKQKIEEQRVLANVLGLAVVISVYFSKVCAQAIDFYLDDKYTKEREALVKLCRDKKSSNEEIMAYIREAQRIGQHFGLWRNVNLAQGQTRRIKQGHGYPDIVIEPGDRVYADFSWAHNDPKQFSDPEIVKTDRGIKSLLGLGVHKCPAGSFMDQTMSEIVRVVFKQEGLSRANGREGRLNVTTLHPDAAPWDTEVFLDDDGSFSYYPRKMVLTMNAKNLEKPDWKIQEDELTEKLRKKIDRGCTFVVIFIVLSLVLYIFTSVGLFSLPTLSTPSSGPTNPTECGGPLKVIEEYHIRAFQPKWFGLFGEPGPLLYKTKGRKGHQISVVDIDRRDIEIRMWVDDEDRGHRQVNLDEPTVDCGEDLGLCINLGFAAASIFVPPGKHTIKAEIRKRAANETFVWGKERKRRVMWRVEQCV